MIIDVQRVFEDGPHQAFQAAEVIARLNQITQAARQTQTPVFMVQHAATSGPLAYGEPGWAFAHLLTVSPADTVVHKNTADAFHNTTLHAQLQARGITELIVGGIQTDFCVDTSIRRALALGYAISLVSDGHTTLDNTVLSAEQIIAHHNVNLSSISSFGPRVTLVPAAVMATTLAA
ncbi:isochorismatase family protein [Limnohabitans radicicola]|uniref:isochorismatase family protein n=1 Tax=Limnohabitans radicicola TaxID=2771427 RepID=UPI002FCF3DF4